MSVAINDNAQTLVAFRPPLACVAQPAVLQGEKTADFETLLAGISSALRPADIFEENWTHDMADLVWEGFRLRRLKAAPMREDAYEGGLMTSMRHIMANRANARKSTSNTMSSARARRRRAIREFDTMVPDATGAKKLRNEANG